LEHYPRIETQLAVRRWEQAANRGSAALEPPQPASTALSGAMRDEAQRQKQPGSHAGVRDQVQTTRAAVRVSLARAHAAFDQTRQQVQEAEAWRQRRRASAERKADQHPRPRGDHSPSLNPQASDAPPEAVPLSEPPTKNESE